MRRANAAAPSQDMHSFTEDNELDRALSIRAALRSERRRLRDVGKDYAADGLFNYLMHADPASLLRLREAVLSA